MSAERPEAGVPAQPSPDPSVPLESEVVAPSSAEPTLPQHTVEPTRTSMVWTMVGLGVVLSFAIVVFILQNSPCPARACGHRPGRRALPAASGIHPSL